MAARIEVFPPVLLEMPSLSELDLSSNRLTTLPEDIGKLQGLVSLDPITTIFLVGLAESGQLTGLVYLRISNAWG